MHLATSSRSHCYLRPSHDVRLSMRHAGSPPPRKPHKPYAKTYKTAKPYYKTTKPYYKTTKPYYKTTKPYYKHKPPPPKTTG